MSLKLLFGLSPAEIKVAQRLVRGDSLEETAKALCIRMSTARTQLAGVFAKMGTNRQPRLVAVLSRLAHLEQRGLFDDLQMKE